MSRFFKSFIAGGFAMSALTFTMYKSMQDTVDYVQDRVVQMRCTLEPRLRFHLLKDRAPPSSGQENNETTSLTGILDKIDNANVYDEAQRQISVYKPVITNGIKSRISCGTSGLSSKLRNSALILPRCKVILYRLAR